MVRPGPAAHAEHESVGVATRWRGKAKTREASEAPRVLTIDAVLLSGERSSGADRVPKNARLAVEIVLAIGVVGEGLEH